jgi:drug/metabolite transporter superfamily protein YnfA
MPKAMVLFLAAGLAEIGGGYLGIPERTRNGIIASQLACLKIIHQLVSQ